MMITFKTVEDYIEVIAGERDAITGKLVGGWANDPIISLARYDVEVIRKMSEQCMNNIAMTQRQAQLATKIILNYKRQLGNKNVDVSPVENPVYRNPLREIDYSCKLFISDDSLCLKFPYNPKIIEGIRSFSKESQGRCRWVPESKWWSIALTEYNLNWIATFAEINNFEIDHEVKELVRKVAEAEQTGFKIELTITDQTLELTNAPDTLQEYVNKHLGEVTLDNLIRLVDYSSILGYTVDENIEAALAVEYGFRFVHLATNRELKLDPSSMFSGDNFNSVIDYAIECDRLPVYVYEPDLSGKLLARVLERFDHEQIVLAKNDSYVDQLSDKTMVVHTIKPIKGQRIPLLISSAGMIYGGDKECMVQAAEKIVYCAAEVYNKRTPANGVKKLAS